MFTSSCEIVKCTSVRELTELIFPQSLEGQIILKNSSFLPYIHHFVEEILYFFFLSVLVLLNMKYFDFVKFSLLGINHRFLMTFPHFKKAFVSFSIPTFIVTLLLPMKDLPF